MDNLPALPTSQSQESAERSLALLLQRVASDGQSGKLEVNQSTSGEWILSPSSDLSSQKLGFALDCARQSPGFLIPGDADEIEAAIIELKAATMRSPTMDDETEVVYEAALAKALEDYPIDVVQDACRNWRKIPGIGKWWPSEQDLRAECERLFAPRKVLFNKARTLLIEIRKREDAEKRISAFAGSRATQFKNAMAERMTPARYDAYFHSSQLKYVRDEIILVRTKAGINALSDVGGDLLSSLGLELRYDPQAFLGIRQPTYEDDTPEERAQVMRKFNRLALAMSRGENLARLRATGEI